MKKQLIKILLEKIESLEERNNSLQKQISEFQKNIEKVQVNEPTKNTEEQWVEESVGGLKVRRPIYVEKQETHTENVDLLNLTKEQKLQRYRTGSGRLNEIGISNFDRVAVNDKPVNIRNPQNGKWTTSEIGETLNRKKMEKQKEQLLTSVVGDLKTTREHDLRVAEAVKKVEKETK